MIKLVEVKKITDFNVMERRASAHFELDEIWLNPELILQIKSDQRMRTNLKKGFLPEKMDDRQQFSRVSFGTGNNVSVVTVVGSPETVAEKIYKFTSTEILKG